MTTARTEITLFEAQSLTEAELDRAVMDMIERLSQLHGGLWSVSLGSDNVYRPVRVDQ